MAAKKKKIMKKKLAKKPKKVLRKKKLQIKKKKTVVKKVKKAVVRKFKKLKVKSQKLKISRPVKKRSRAKSQAPKIPFLAESFFKAKIKVIGIGGGGGSIVSEIGRSLHKATFVVADTDMRAQKRRPGIKYFLFGQKLTHGLGTGVNPQLGRQAAEQEKERISHFFDDQDIVILISSLGGGLGSGATQVFAEAAKNFNGITFGIFTLPFKFEGKNKYAIAQKSLKELRKLLNVSITIPNERIFKIIDQNTAITDAFSMVNRNLIESLESLIDLIYNPGIINIDFADLRAILKGRGSLAFLNTAEARGKQRADQVAHDVLHNSLYQSNNFGAEQILFNIEGDASLSMVEVDKISRKISEQNPKAKIIFGISKNPALKNKIKTTLLMTGGGVEEKIVVPKAVVENSAKEPAKSSPKKAIKKKRKKVTFRKKRAIDTNKQPEAQHVPFNEFPPVEPSMDFLRQVNAAVSPQRSLVPNNGVKKISVVESLYNKPKKAIRRSALEIKKQQELDENKQTSQEKEWEIPAFMRLKNK